MQSFRTSLLVATLIFSSLILYGQDSSRLYQPKDYLDAGYSYINDDQDYEKAALEFAKIIPNDTLYDKANYNRIVCLRTIGKHNEALELIDNAMSLNNEYVVDIYLNKVWCLDSLNLKKEAYAVIDSAELIFPYNYKIKKARAPLLESEGKYKEAWDIYKQCVRDEPFHANHHLDVAKFTAKAGGLTHAVLPLVIALLVNPEASNNGNILSAANNLVTSKNELNNPIFDLSLLEDDFEEIDDLVENYIALDDKYVVPGEFQFGIVKQMHMIIEETELGEGFFSKVYLRPLKETLNQNDFSYLAALMCLSSTSENHQDYIGKNKQNIINVLNLFKDKINSTNTSRTPPLGMQIEDIDYLYNDDGTLRCIGNYTKEQDILTGETVFFDFRGGIEQKGEYSASGLITGDWLIYHNNGVVARRATFKDGKEHGTTTYYTDNGRKSTVAQFKNGLLNGVLENYKLIGYKYEDVNYVNGEKHGLNIGYYPDNSINYKYTFKNGKCEGPVQFFYDNGAKLREGLFKNDLYEGELKSFFRNQKIQSSEVYESGILNGPYSLYFEDGQIQNTGTFKDGKKVGVWKEFNSAGVLVQMEEYDEGGKVNGPTKNLDHLGRVETIYMKKKGTITELINYDLDGKVISTFKIKGKELDFDNLTVNGVINIEGKIVDDLREGTWKYYSNYGSLAKTTNYENGVLSGVEQVYYINGAIYSSTTHNNDMLNGPYLEYHMDGSLKQQSSYKNNDLDGRFITYGVTGEVELDLYYQEGMQVGINTYNNPDGTPYLISKYDYGYPIVESRYDPNGKLTSSNTIEDGVGVDEYYFYADKKNVMGSVAYVGGTKNGPTSRFHFNGELRLTGAYVNGNRHGEFVEYYYDGSIKSTNHYEYGQSVGTWIEYSEDGQVQSTSQFNYGRIDENYLSYFDNRSLQSSITYVNGILQGPAIFYNYNGEHCITLYYENDVLLGYSSIKEDGNQDDMKAVTKGTALIESYFPNKQVSTTYNLKVGYIDGEYLSYYSNGNKESSIQYNNGFYQGKAISYYDNGNIRSDLDYVMDALNGVQKYYYPDGKLKRLENWLVGEKNGDTVYYDQNGKETKTIRYYGNVPYRIK